MVLCASAPRRTLRPHTPCAPVSELDVRPGDASASGAAGDVMPPGDAAAALGFGEGTVMEVAVAGAPVLTSDAHDTGSGDSVAALGVRGLVVAGAAGDAG